MSTKKQALLAGAITLVVLFFCSLLAAFASGPAGNSNGSTAVGNGSSAAAYLSGTVTAGNCAKIGAAVNTIEDSGAACGTGAVSSVTASGNLASSGGPNPDITITNSPAFSGFITVGTYLQVGAAVVSTTTGDGNFSRSASTGQINFGGGTHYGTLDYGIANTSAFTLGADIGANTDLYLNSNAVGKLHAGGAVLNGLGVAGLIVNGTATTVPHEETGRIVATTSALCSSLATCSLTGNTVTFTQSFADAPVCTFTASSSAFGYHVQNDDATTTTTATFLIIALGAIPGSSSLPVNYDCKGT